MARMSAAGASLAKGTIFSGPAEQSLPFCSRSGDPRLHALAHLSR